MQKPRKTVPAHVCPTPAPPTMSQTHANPNKTQKPCLSATYKKCLNTTKRKICKLGRSFGFKKPILELMFWCTARRLLFVVVWVGCLSEGRWGCMVVTTIDTHRIEYLSSAHSKPRTKTRKTCMRVCCKARHKGHQNPKGSCRHARASHMSQQQHHQPNH